MNRAPSRELLERIADRLKALADPTRLRILHALEDRELNVSDLLAVVGGSQANVSKHLARMRLAGLVKARREGTNVYYRVADEAADQLLTSDPAAAARHLDRWLGGRSEFVKA